MRTARTGPACEILATLVFVHFVMESIASINGSMIGSVTVVCFCSRMMFILDGRLPKVGRKIDLLYLEGFDLNAPLFRALAELFFQIMGDALAVVEQLLETMVMNGRCEH